MKGTILFVILISVCLAAGSKDNTEGPMPSWQQSESLNIQLGVRDKNASMEYYEAVFTVRATDGDKDFEARLKIAGDEWGFVNFPDDFSMAVNEGDYEWKCMVSGKEVSGGKFTFGKYQRSIMIPEK